MISVEVEETAALGWFTSSFSVGYERQGRVETDDDDDDDEYFLYTKGYRVYLREHFSLELSLTESFIPITIPLYTIRYRPILIRGILGRGGGVIKFLFSTTVDSR